MCKPAEYSDWLNDINHPNPYWPTDNHQNKLIIINLLYWHHITHVIHAGIFFAPKKKKKVQWEMADGNV